jgi:hypothetical protein
MPQQLRSDEYCKLAKDFLRRAENAPTKEEREDFLDMARAIERAAAKVKPPGDNKDRHMRANP